ncbi:hypothetical protein BgiMline_015608 [Biomphalaria glabrata]|nr:hypothetical protein BgiMline_008429 [Biomphalaria glabrata]
MDTMDTMETSPSSDGNEAVRTKVSTLISQFNSIQQSTPPITKSNSFKIPCKIRKIDQIPSDVTRSQSLSYKTSEPDVPRKVHHNNKKRNSLTDNAEMTHNGERESSGYALKKAPIKDSKYDTIPKAGFVSKAKKELENMSKLDTDSCAQDEIAADNSSVRFRTVTSWSKMRKSIDKSYVAKTTHGSAALSDSNDPRGNLVVADVNSPTGQSGLGWKTNPFVELMKQASIEKNPVSPDRTTTSLNWNSSNIDRAANADKATANYKINSSSLGRGAASTSNSSIVKSNTDSSGIKFPQVSLKKITTISLSREHSDFLGGTNSCIVESNLSHNSTEKPNEPLNISSISQPNTINQNKDISLLTKKNLNGVNKNISLHSYRYQYELSNTEKSTLIRSSAFNQRFIPSSVSNTPTDKSVHSNDHPNQTPAYLTNSRTKTFHTVISEQAEIQTQRNEVRTNAHVTSGKLKQKYDVTGNQICTSSTLDIDKGKQFGSSSGDVPSKQICATIDPPSDNVIVHPPSGNVIVNQTSDNVIVNQTSDYVIVNQTSDNVIVNQTSDNVIVNPPSDNVIVNPPSDNVIVNQEKLMGQTSDSENHLNGHLLNDQTKSIGSTSGEKTKHSGQLATRKLSLPNSISLEHIEQLSTSSDSPSRHLSPNGEYTPKQFHFSNDDRKPNLNVIAEQQLKPPNGILNSRIKSLRSATFDQPETNSQKSNTKSFTGDQKTVTSITSSAEQGVTHVIPSLHIRNEGRNGGPLDQASQENGVDLDADHVTLRNPKTKNTSNIAKVASYGFSTKQFTLPSQSYVTADVKETSPDSNCDTTKHLMDIQQVQTTKSEYCSAADRINRHLIKLKTELMSMHEQDLVLLKQLINISQTIQKLQRSQVLRISKSLSFSSGLLHPQPLHSQKRSHSSSLVRQNSAPFSIEKRRQLFSLMRASTEHCSDGSLSSFDESEFDSQSEMDESNPSLTSLYPYLSPKSNRARPMFQYSTSQMPLCVDMAEDPDETYEDILKRNVMLWKMSLQRQASVIHEVTCLL